MADDAVWFLQGDEERTTPLTADQLRTLLESGRISPDIHVQHQKLPTWLPIVAVKGLSEVVQRLRQEQASARPKPVGDSVWMIAVDGKQDGPMSRAEIARRAKRGMLHADTLVWREGMRGWVRLDQVAELSGVLPAPDSITATGRVRVLTREEAKARLAKATPKSLGECRRYLERNPEHEPTLQVLETFVRMGKDAAASVELLESVLVPRGEWQRLMASWRNLLRAVREPEARTDLRMRMAQAAGGPLEAPQQAYAIYTSALRESPRRADLHAALERVAERLERLDELVGLLDEQVLAHEGAERAALLAFAARVDLERRGDTEAAATRLTDAARLDPSPAVLEALERLGERTDDWWPWADGLRAAADVAEGDDKVPHLHQLANALQVRLDRAVRAVGVYAEILEVAPDDPQTRDALQRLHRRGVAPDAVYPLLRALYTAEEDDAALRDLEVAHLPHRAPGLERAEALAGLATLCRDRLKDRAAAVSWLEQAVRQAPDQVDLRAAYLDEATSEGRLADAVAALEAILEDAPSLQVELAWALFELHAERLDAPEDAAPWAERAIAGAAPEALVEMEPALAGYPAQRVAALERMIASPAPGADVTALRLRLARAHHRDGDDEAAVRSYQALLTDAPEHGEALVELAGLHAVAERWDAWLEVRRAQADACVEEAPRIAIWRETADRMAELARHEEAAELRRRILAADPDDVAALDGLEASSTAQDDWAGLADALERRRARAEGADALEVTRRLALVYADRLDDRARAAACWRAIVRATPEDLGARRALARTAEGAEALAAWRLVFEADTADTEAANALAALHDATGAGAAMVDVRLRHIETFTDEAAAVDALRALAATCDDRELDGAAVYRALLRRRPADAAASQALSRLYAAREDWAALEQTLRERLEQTEAPAGRRALQVQLAELQAERMGRPAAAMETIGAAFQADPTDELGPEIARLAALTGAWDRALSLYEGALAEAPVPLAVALHRRMGAWCAGPHDDVDLAIHHYGRVLDLLPADADAVRALETLFASGRGRAEIVALLDPVLTAEGRFDALAELLTDTLPPRGERRRAALRRLGQIYEVQLEDPRAALDHYGLGLEADPGSAELLADLQRTGETLARQDLVADAMTRALFDAERPDQVVPLGAALAPLLEELGRRGRALAVYTRILDADPSHAAALAALDAAAVEQGDVAALCDILRRRLAVSSDPEDRRRLTTRLAEAWVRRDRPADAIDVWTALLAWAPDDPQALEALDALYVATEDWEALANVRQRRAELATGPEQAALLASLAEVVQTHLGDADAAVQMLQRLVAASLATPEHLDRLEGLLREAKRWSELEALMESQLPASVERELHLFTVMAEAQIAQEHGRDALESWRQVLERDPENEAALRASRALYAARDQGAGVARSDLALAELLDDADPEKALLLREAAGLLTELGQPAEAAAAWQRLRAVHPEDLQAREALEALYISSGAWDKLRDLLRSVLARTHDSDSRLALHLRVAELSADRLDDLRGAREAYETALSESPGSPGATLALGRLYRRQEDWTAWVQLSMARLGDVQDPKARRAIYVEAADILVDRLDSAAHALALLGRSIQEHPDDGLGDRFEALAEALGRWPEVIHLYEGAIEDAEPEAARALHLRVAGWIETRLEEFPRAVAHYRAMLAEDPGDEAALAALHRLFEAGHARAAIVDELARRHAEAEDWQRLHELLAAAVPASPAAARAEAWRRLGALAADRLGAPHRAFDWYARALTELPDDDEARERLLSLAESTGRLEALAGVFARALPRTETTVRPVGYALADIYERIGDPEGAEQVYVVLLERLGAAESAALAALEARYTAAGRWSALAERLEAALTANPHDDQRADIATRLARVYEERLGQAAKAVHAWQMVLAVEPQDEDALSGLARLHQTQQQWAPLFEVYQREADADPAVRGSRYADMAQIAAEHLGAPDRAIALWALSLEHGGEEAPALAALQQLYLQQGCHEELVGILDRRIALVDPDEAVELIRLKARTITEQLDAPVAGRRAWEAVLQRAPGDAEALRQLWHLVPDSEPDSVARVTEALLPHLVEGSKDWPAVQRDRARACDALGQANGARVAWEAVRTALPGDAEAEARLAALYRESEDTAALVALCEGRIAAAETEGDRVEHLIELAGVHAGVGDDVAAHAALDRAMAVRPEDDALAERLIGLHVEAGRWGAVSRLLLRGRDRLEGEALRQLHRRAAERLADDYGQPAEALAVAGQGFSDDPEDLIYGPVIERYAQASGDWTTAAGLYVSRLSRLDNQGVHPRLRLARWYADHLGDDAAAMTQLEVVLEREPEHPEAGVALVAVRRRQGDPAALLTTLMAQAEQTPGEAGLTLRVEAAELAASQLEAPAQIDAWRSVLAVDDSHRAALNALQALYAQTEAWTDLAGVLSRKAELANPEEAAELRLAIADVNADHLGDEDGAMEAYKRALGVDPNNQTALAGVERVLSRQSRWDELVRFHEERLAVAPPAERHAIYARIAEIQAEKQHNMAAARGTERMMRQSATARGRSTQALERVYIESGRWEDLAALYERRLKVIPEGAQERSLRTTMATIYADKLGDLDKAIEVLEPLLDSDDADHQEIREALEMLLMLHDRREDWSGSVEVLKKLAKTHRKTDEKVEAYMRIGRMYADRLDNPMLATQWWREALELDNHHRPAIKAIEALHAKIRAEYDAQRQQAEEERRRVEEEEAAKAAGRAAAAAAEAAARGEFAVAEYPEPAPAPVAPPPPEPRPDLARAPAFEDPERPWLVPAIGGAGFALVAAVVLWSVWPQGRSLEPSFAGLERAVQLSVEGEGPARAEKPGPSSIPPRAPATSSQRSPAQPDITAEAMVVQRMTQRVDENLVAIETALMSTGLDYEALLAPVVDVARDPAGPAGGPYVEPEQTPHGFVSPIAGPLRILSPYGPRGREHHDGIDYLAPVGTPVRAVAGGEVIFIQSRDNWERRDKFVERAGETVKSGAWRAGVYVEVRHDDQKVSRYMHLHHVAQGIETGIRVQAKQVIGYVGRTAVEHSATHLHFELRDPDPNGGRYGNSMDPMPVVHPGDQSFIAGTAALHARTDLSKAPGGPQAQREVRERLRGLGLVEKMDRLQNLERLLQQLPLVPPVEDLRLSSTFGRRIDPGTGQPGFHSGVDIPGELKSSIKSTAPGTVVYAGWRGHLGRVVEVDHGNGIVTRYGHLYAALVRPGQPVRYREKIGEMGTSGRSTGTHLHYEVLVDGEHQDPLKFLQAGRYIFKR